MASLLMLDMCECGVDSLASELGRRAVVTNFAGAFGVVKTCATEDGAAQRSCLLAE